MSLRQGGLVAGCGRLSDLISVLSGQSAALSSFLLSSQRSTGAQTPHSFLSLSIVQLDLKLPNYSPNGNQCCTFCMHGVAVCFYVGGGVPVCGLPVCCTFYVCGVPVCGDDTWRDPETAAGDAVDTKVPLYIHIQTHVHMFAVHIIYTNVLPRYNTGSVDT